MVSRTRPHSSSQLFPPRRKHWDNSGEENNFLEGTNPEQKTCNDMFWCLVEIKVLCAENLEVNLAKQLGCWNFKSIMCRSPGKPPMFFQQVAMGLDLDLFSSWEKKKKNPLKRGSEMHKAFFLLPEAQFALHAVPPVVALWQTDATAASADVTWLLLLLLL